MKTRRGACYSCHAAAAATAPGEGPEAQRRKRRRTAAEGSPAAAAAAGAPGVRLVARDMFEELPDDLVVSILRDVAASAGSPANLAGAMLTCKRFRELGQSKVVLARASPRCLAVRAKAWSEEAHRFLQRCADAGSLEACYLLGMIRFYCLGIRGSGAALMAAAAVGGHREALYSLAVVQFNGSGGGKDDRDLRAGAALCARAASLGHVGALRELGHCLQDGYGVRRDPAEGRRLLVSANARELTLALSAAASRHAAGVVVGGGGGCPLLSDFGWSLPEAEPHAANQFMVDWWWASDRCAAQAGGKITGDSGDGAELRLCSHVRCGRRETRRHEFRRCSVCGAANYCSRACQALDWKRAHKVQCVPVDRWLLAAVGDAQDQQQQQQ